MPPGFEYLPASRVKLGRQPGNWRDAVRLVGQPLVAEGLVEPSYVEAAITIAEEKGPFFDLGKGIAMPHARPESGAKAVGLSFLRCDRPVNLLDRDDHPIDIFIMLAATDGASHLEMLRRLAVVLIDDDRVERLKTVSMPVEVVSVFAETNDY